jgi:hypothetical protein
MPQQPGVSVIEPISPAIEKVKVILFKPFDLSRWFIIGFCAWLAYLGQGGVRCNFNFPFRGSKTHATLPGGLEDLFANNLPLIIFFGSIALVLGLAIVIVCLWLSSRGRFMFLACIARNKAEVKTPWHRFREHANSLFLFRLAVGIIFFICFILFIGTLVLFVALFSRNHVHMGIGAVGLLMFLLLIVVSVGIIFALILKFTADFVVPVMYLRSCSCVEAWHEFWTLLSDNKGAFTIYILFQIVIAMVICAIVAAAVIITCCCAALFLAIPYIGTVLMLPLLVFQRAYSLCYLRQFGARFDVFTA